MTDREALFGVMGKFVDSLPPEQQAELEALRMNAPDEYEARVRAMMGE
jgi:hypothetical protein